MVSFAVRRQRPGAEGQTPGAEPNRRGQMSAEPRVEDQLPEEARAGVANAPEVPSTETAGTGGTEEPTRTRDVYSCCESLSIANCELFPTSVVSTS